jgi:hypothetical protein
MAKDSVSNQNRVIATKGTKHKARTRGPTDVCKNPKGDTAPFPNEVPTKRLLKNRTQITRIAADPIWIKPSEVGPFSDPVHAPFPIGANNNKPYRSWAKATSYSSDVFSEGEPVVRTDDNTTQNRENTTGYVDGSEVQLSEGLTEALARLKCCFPEEGGLEGESGEGKDARHLGWDGPKPEHRDGDFLEVLSGSKIKLTSKRVDISNEKAPITDPACQLVPEHTTWLITRQGGGSAAVTKREKGKVYTVGSELTCGWGIFADRLGNLEGTGKNKTKWDVEEKTIKQKTTVSGAGETIQFLYELWKFRNGPAVILAQAQSCGGNKTATIRVFPGKQVKLTFTRGKETERKTESEKGNELVESLFNKLAWVDKIAKVCKFAFELKPGFKFTYKMLEGFQLDIEAGYKVCKETKKTRHGILKTPAHVGLPWRVSVAMSPLLEIGCRLAISIVSFICPLLEGAANILEKYDIKADIELSASLSCVPKITVGQDEFEYFTSTGGTITLTLTFTAELIIQLTKKIKALTAGLRAAGSIELQVGCPESRDYLFKLIFSGAIETSVYLIVLQDSWFETPLRAKPECLQVETKKLGSMDVGKMPSS